MELTLLGERILNVVGENVNENGQRGVGVKKDGTRFGGMQLEFLII